MILAVWNFHFVLKQPQANRKLQWQRGDRVLWTWQVAWTLPTASFSLFKTRSCIFYEDIFVYRHSFKNQESCTKTLLARSSSIWLLFLNFNLLFACGHMCFWVFVDVDMNIGVCVCVCIWCVCLSKATCMSRMCGSQRTTFRLDFLLYSGYWGWNSGHQTCMASSLHTEHLTDTIQLI